MLEEMGEENIYGTMLTEPQNPGPDDCVEDLLLHINSKVTACAKLKQWIELKIS